MSGDKVKLRSSDEDMFEVPLDVANESATIKCVLPHTNVEVVAGRPLEKQYLRLCGRGGTACLTHNRDR